MIARREHDDNALASFAGRDVSAREDESMASSSTYPTPSPQENTQNLGGDSEPSATSARSMQMHLQRVSLDPKVAQMEQTREVCDKIIDIIEPMVAAVMDDVKAECRNKIYNYLLTLPINQNAQDGNETTDIKADTKTATREISAITTSTKTGGTDGSYTDSSSSLLDFDPHGEHCIFDYQPLMIARC
ncbi:unnamed protein product [Vitrella brassicaformis CCMP3155]|uniref:Uncharacterized protein n=1 Tax=Vitrella brassicaformis (strain CCMP3155) TaxID=1169540 RepID=A0A0G4GV41_VITBC|nr:unnamed protein product [Vitrella brassicaformis CCMP3155]|eukprot:CEM34763.1 unnamed protein product [Vitrella brassicaformis CCMP3155]